MEFILQFGLVLLLVLLNGYFVASEFALVAVRKTRIAELASKGNVAAKLLQTSLHDLDNFISATQLGITLASLALGWVGEPAVAHFIQPFFSFLPPAGAIVTSHTLSVVIAFSFITFMHIVLGELAPKSIALERSEATALIIITPLLIFSRIFKPFIWLLNNSGHLILRLIGLKRSGDAGVVHSEEEVRMILRQSSEEGTIPAKEVEMVYNVFQLSDIPVKIVMVPRPEVLAFNVTSLLRDIVKKIESHPHSRFPVFESSIDNVIGFIHVKDVYRELLSKGETVRLSHLDIIRKVLIVPEVKKIDAVLSEMRRKRIHLAVVTDEYGGTAGVVTLEDIIESVVGEIEDEFDSPIQNIQRLKDKSYLIEGHTPIDDVRKKFNLALKGQGYTTIGGLVFGLLGHEPEKGDSVEINNLSLEVEEMEGKRIKRIKLKRKSKR
jgi:CBS domain containing-hemolysin-like protein